MPGQTPASSGVEVSPEVRLVLLRWVMRPSWLLATTLVLLFAAGLEVPTWAQYLPFALSLVVFGLPHGAVDHLVVPCLLGRKAWPGPVLVVGLLYLALGGSYLVLWFVMPVLAFALFVLLTWFHWGAGDLYVLLAFAPNGTGYLRTRTSRILNLLVRGGLPMLVPLLAFPETYRAVAGSVIGLFASGSTDDLSLAFGPYFRLVAGVVFVLVAVGVLVSGYASAKKAGARGAWAIDAAETALLALYFAFVPPVLAVGLYFCLWHSVRHVVRLILLDEKGAATLAAGRVTPALVRFMQDALPLTVAALVLLVWLYLVVPGAAGVDLATLLALYLVLISTLTFPHVVVVAVMDLRQGLWRRPKSQA